MKVWTELSPEKKACLKEKWMKEKNAIMMVAEKTCKDSKEGLACFKAIPIVQPCFA